MASQLIVLFAAFLAVVRAGVISPISYAAGPLVANPAVDAVATTHQNVVRSFGGTVSQYSKAIDTPYSSVRKQDTRISNNVYTPTIAKSLTYAAPTVAKTVTYSQALPQAAVYSHAAPVFSNSIYNAAAPAVYTHHEHSAPVYAHHQTVPAAAVYAHAAPAVANTITYAAPADHVYHHAAPLTAAATYNHGPAATTYSHSAPGVAAYGASQTVHYSPAEMVSHMSFDGFGTHWGF